MKQVIKLAETDDITTIRNRIDYAFPPPLMAAEKGNAERKLLLVVPRKNEAMQSLVNMKLLARVMRGRAVEVAVVSPVAKVRDHAREASLKTFGSFQRAKWAGWVPTGDGDSEPELPATPEPSPDKPKPSRKKRYVVVTGPGRVNILQQIGAFVLVLGLAFILVLSILALVPTATITLTPVAQEIQAEVIVHADPEAESTNFQTLTFPARIEQVDLAIPGEIDTTETEWAPVGQATGFATFINRTGEPVLIPISTTVSTSAGQPLQFATVITTQIPPGTGATTRTRVIALAPGSRSNIAPGQLNRFTDPAFNVIARVVNESGFDGGTYEPAHIVVQDDKERLQAHLRQKVQQEGFARLQEALSGQEFISPETLQVIVLAVTYDQFAGDFSDTFSGEMQAAVRGTVVGGYNANRLALAALEARVPNNHELDLRDLHFGAGEVLNVENGVVTFRIEATGRAIPLIDRNAAAEDIAWLPIGEAQAQLSSQYQLATVPGVELSPGWANWLGRLPYYSMRIEVIVNEPVIFMADSS